VLPAEVAMPAAAVAGLVRSHAHVAACTHARTSSQTSVNNSCIAIDQVVSVS
jgi:hypothetical protein